MLQVKTTVEPAEVHQEESRRHSEEGKSRKSRKEHHEIEQKSSRVKKDTTRQKKKSSEGEPRPRDSFPLHYTREEKEWLKEKLLEEFERQEAIQRDVPAEVEARSKGMEQEEIPEDGRSTRMDTDGRSTRMETDGGRSTMLSSPVRQGSPPCLCAEEETKSKSRSKTPDTSLGRRREKESRQGEGERKKGIRKQSREWEELLALEEQIKETKAARERVEEERRQTKEEEERMQSKEGDPRWEKRTNSKSPGKHQLSPPESRKRKVSPGLASGRRSRARDPDHPATMPRESSPAMGDLALRHGGTMPKDHSLHSRDHSPGIALKPR